MGALDGFKVTFKTMFEEKLTDRYPHEKREKPERFHGRHVLNRYEDGMEKCIGCELCAGVCPPDASTCAAWTTPRTRRCPPASGTGSSTRSTICGASTATCASRRARPR